jgi:hypothetical protein
MGAIVQHAFEIILVGVNVACAQASVNEALHVYKNLAILRFNKRF